MPCSSAEEFVALDGFERGEGRDEIDQGEAKTTDESTVSRVTRPQTLSVIPEFSIFLKNHYITIILISKFLWI